MDEGENSPFVQNKNTTESLALAVFVRDYFAALIHLTMLQNIQTGGGISAVIEGLSTWQHSTPSSLVPSRAYLVKTVACEMRHGCGFGQILSISKVLHTSGKGGTC